MTVQLRPEVESQLEQEARESGQSLDDLFASIADEYLRRRAIERAEDEEDLRVGLEVLATSDPSQRLTTEQVMADLGLSHKEVEHAR